MCINDGYHIQDERQIVEDFLTAMEQLLPAKSSFEL